MCKSAWRTTRNICPSGPGELGWTAVIARSSYVPRAQPSAWRSIKLVRVWSPRIKGRGGLLHRVRRRAARGLDAPGHRHPAVGPALFNPAFAPFDCGLVTSTTSLNDENDKWGFVAAIGLARGARGMMFPIGASRVGGLLRPSGALLIRSRWRVHPEWESAIAENAIDRDLERLSARCRASTQLTVARVDDQKPPARSDLGFFPRHAVRPCLSQIVEGADYSRNMPAPSARGAAAMASSMLRHQTARARRTIPHPAYRAAVHPGRPAARCFEQDYAAPPSLAICRAPPRSAA